MLLDKPISVAIARIEGFSSKCAKTIRVLFAVVLNCGSFSAFQILHNFLNSFQCYKTLHTGDVSVDILWHIELQLHVHSFYIHRILTAYQLSHYRNIFSTNWNWTIICSNNKLRLNIRTIEAFELRYITSWYFFYIHTTYTWTTFGNIMNSETLRLFFTLTVRSGAHTRTHPHAHAPARIRTRTHTHARTRARAHICSNRASFDT